MIKGRFGQPSADGAVFLLNWEFVNNEDLIPSFPFDPPFSFQVRRNISRFPDDFMFQLNADEYAALRSQIATLKTGRGGHRKYLPCVFTEQGVAMLSSVLNSERAVQVNITIMRAFVQMREFAASNRVLARRLDELEKI